MCSNTAIAELSKGSNTPPTNSTNLRLTMQHKSGTAQIWRDTGEGKPHAQPRFSITAILLRGHVAAQKHRNRRVHTWQADHSTDAPSRRMDAVSRSAACLPVTLRTQMRYSGRGWPCFAVGARRCTLVCVYIKLMIDQSTTVIWYDLSCRITKNEGRQGEAVLPVQSKVRLNSCIRRTRAAELKLEGLQSGPNLKWRKLKKNLER